MADCAKGLFLDLDGTLAASLPVMRTVYESFMNKFGEIGKDAEFDSLNGPPIEQVVATLADTYQLSPPVCELVATYRHLIQVAYEDVRPHDGALELLKTAKTLGYRICVVTSNSGDLTRAWLRRTGLSVRIDAVVSGDEVEHGKPHPQPYLAALAKTACLAEESLAVEDSVMGASASKAAGIHTLLLSNAEIPLSVSCITRLSDVTNFLR